jgi:hypothetical protein
MFQRCRISSRRVGGAGRGGAFNESHRMASIHLTRSPTMNASRLLAAVAALVLAAGAAQAGTRHTTLTGPNGASAARTVQRGGGQVTDTTTGPNGGTRVRQVNRTASGTSATITHVNGTTTTRDTERSATGSTTTVTGPDGKTGTVVVTH